MKRRVLSAILLIAVVFLFAGCGNKKVSTEQIKEDILSIDSVYNDYGMTITDYSENRYEGKQDEDKEAVRVTVTAENDIFEFQCEYTLYYIRLSDGWELQFLDDEIIATTPKVDLEYDRILADVQDYYRETLAEYQLTEQSFGNVEVVDEDGSINAFIPYRVYRVPFTGSNDLVRVDAQLAIGYQLDHSKGWVISNGEFGFRGAKTEIQSTPVSSPDSAIAQLMKEEGMESYEILSETDQSGKYQQKISYEIRGTDTDGTKYATMIYDFDINCLFDEKEGWKADIAYDDRILSDAIPHVEGTWLYDDGTGRNRFEIYVERMDLDTISLSYDIIMTDYEDSDTRHVCSDGIVTMDVNASRVGRDSLRISLDKNIAGPEGKGAGSYRLWFYNYIQGHEEYENSGFKLDGCLLKKIS